jgi:hypothetical protein
LGLHDAQILRPLTDRDRPGRGDAEATDRPARMAKCAVDDLAPEEIHRR